MTGVYARCPHCRTVFSVTPGALAAAGGWVRCGACLKPFDAHRGLLPGRAREADAGPRREPAAAPEAPPAPDPADNPLPGPGGWYLVPEDEARGEASPGAGAPPVVVLERAPVEAEPEPGAPEAGSDAGEAKALPGAGDLPEALAEDAAALAAPRPSLPRRLAQGAALVVLVLLLVLQTALFHPQAAGYALPPARGVLEGLLPLRQALYQALGQPERGPYRAPELYRLAARDVRTRPGEDRALQVTATLVNGAPLSQPLPRVRLTLFDVNGAVIAERRFAPGEYARVADPEAYRLAPGTRFHLDLELWVPPVTPVSYAFAFE